MAGVPQGGAAGSSRGSGRCGWRAGQKPYALAPRPREPLKDRVSGWLPGERLTIFSALGVFRPVQPDLLCFNFSPFLL